MKTKIMKTILLLIIAAITLPSAYSAVIHGEIYDIELERARDVRVEIDTEPTQHYIAKNASYQFEVPQGDYTIMAEYIEDGLTISKTEENISIVDEGNYVLDLILFPEMDEDEELELNISETDMEMEEGTGLFLMFAIIGGFFLMVFLISKAISKMMKPKRDEGVSAQAPKKEEKIGEKGGKSDLDMVIEIIRKEGGRTTQKEIRKEIPLSEAKISLLIAELEHKGLVEKIKRGRGNIIILKQR